MLRAVALAARLGLHDRPRHAGGDPLPARRDREEQPRAPARRDLQDPAPGRVAQDLRDAPRDRACSPTCCPRPTRRSRSSGERLLGSLARLDDYRNAGLAAPDELDATPLLMGTLLVPLGVPLRRAVAAARGVGATTARTSRATSRARRRGRGDGGARRTTATSRRGRRRRAPTRARCRCRSRGATSTGCASSWPRRAACARCTRSPRVKHLLAGRGYLEEALRWLEIHGGVQGQELAAHWRGLELGERAPARAERPRARGEAADGGPPPRRRAAPQAPAPPPPPPSAGRSRPSSAAVRPEEHMAHLTDDEVRERADGAARLGARAARAIRKEYAFADFDEAHGVREPRGRARRGADHHPDILVAVQQVTLTLTQPRRRRPDRARLPAGRGRSTREGAASPARAGSSARRWCRGWADGWPGPAGARRSTCATRRPSARSCGEVGPTS